MPLHQHHGYYKPFIEIHWTPVGSGTSDEAGACELGPGEVVKTGVSWKSGKRKVEAGWSSSIPLDGGPEAEQRLLVDLVQGLEDSGVGAPCAAGKEVPTKPGTQSISMGGVAVGTVFDLPRVVWKEPGFKP